MKQIMRRSLILMVLFLSVLLFQFGCEKDPGEHPAPESTKLQILTAEMWRVDVLHHVIAGQYSAYKSGGANTTGINYDNLRFKFNADGTGKHTDQFGTTFPFTWQFISAEKRSLQLTVNGRTDIWQMLEIAGNYLHASVNLNINGDANNIETFRLIQIVNN